MLSLTFLIDVSITKNFSICLADVLLLIVICIGIIDFIFTKNEAAIVISVPVRLAQKCIVE